MHRAVSVEWGYFLPLISTAAGLGRCLLSQDKAAVCGPLLGPCVAARVCRADPLLHPRGAASVVADVFILSSPPPPV